VLPQTSAHAQAIGTTDRRKQGARGTYNGVVSKHELGHGGVPASSRNGGGPPARTGGGGGGDTRERHDGGGHQGYGFPPGPHGGVQHRVEATRCTSRTSSEPRWCSSSSMGRSETAFLTPSTRGNNTTTSTGPSSQRRRRRRRRRKTTSRSVVVSSVSVTTHR
ncbi:unnamed protein product, partial [Ectocarpus sp. 13 AM-2016]